MSRFKSDVKREEHVVHDVAMLLEDGAVTVSLFRPGTTGTNPGFQDPVAALEQVGKFNARIDPWRGQRFRTLKNHNSGVSTEMLYVGLVLNKRYGFRHGDEWHVGSTVYIVESFDDDRVYAEILLKRRA